MVTLWQDLRFAMRQLSRNSSYALLAVLTLALGIGANTAIFSVVNTYLLKPLPLQNSDRILQVWESWQSGQGTASIPDFSDWRDQNSAFEGLAAYQARSFNLGWTGSPEQLSGSEVTANYFDVMAGTLALGRTFITGEDQQGHNYKVVLSDALWRRLGADRSLIGKTLALDSQDFEVIGVMSPNFRFPNAATELWVPLVPNAELAVARGSHQYLVVGRLKPGVSLQAARSQMTGIAARLEKMHPDSNEGRTVLLVPFQQQLTAGISQSLWLLFAAVAFVFLIACVNIVNLNLTRTASRQREFAVRRAMGASGIRLFRQFMTESVVLTVAGGVAGWILAQWGVQLLTSADKSPLPTFRDVVPDTRVYGFMFLLGLLTAFVLALTSAWKATRANVQQTLKEGGRTASSGKSRQRFNKILVITEVASTVVLLVGAGLMLRTFTALRRVNTGFTIPKNIITMKLSLPPSRFGEAQPVSSFLASATEYLAAVPGVQAAGAITLLPVQESWTNGGFDIVGVNREATSTPESELRAVYGDYYRAMKVPLIRGRYLDERDTTASERVAVINQTVAKKYWQERDPIGSHIKIGGDSRSYTVIGIVQDNLQAGPGVKVQPEIDVSFSQWPATWPAELLNTFSIVVRTSVDPAAITPNLRRAIEQVDPSQAMSRVKTMQRVIDESTSDTQFDAFFLVVFGTVAISLAAIGIYGVLAYGVRLRTHEIGVRMALGARPIGVLGMVLSEGLLLEALGLAIGLTASLYLTRFISALLYGVKNTDVFTLVGVAILITAIVLLACFIPARRAMSVDPVVALRDE